jgi:hypothetical protein
VHGLTAHAYELRRTAGSMSRKVSAYLRHSDSRRSWATTSVWAPLLVYMMIAGSSVRGVDNAGNVTEPPPLWPTLWWLFVFAGCVLLFCPGSELRRRQESLLEMTQRSFVDFEDSTNEILQEATQHRPKVHAAHDEPMTVGIRSR